jgi:hypothetical protein
VLDRAEIRRRNPERTIFLLALVFSVLLHLTAGGVWSFFGHRIAAAVARYLPRPKPTPEEFVALSDAITITKRTVPRPSHASPPRTRPAPPQPRRVAVVPVRPVPTAIPTVVPTVTPTVVPTAVPTIRPTAEPTPRQHARIHHPRPVPTVAPQPRHVAATRPSQRNALSPQQIAALDQQFRRTIDQAQSSVTDVPPQKEPPSSAQRRYKLVMAGTQHDLQEAQGLCYGTAPPLITGMIIQYYVACEIQYPDGFSEHAVIPWPMRFRRDDDPIAQHRTYHPSLPPAGFTLPPDFELSRFVCLYFRPQCVAAIARRTPSGAGAPSSP